MNIRKLVWVYFFVVFFYRAPLINAQAVTCDAKDGKGIVACVAATYPSKLAADVSLKDRTEAMQFLRDRIIETGRCAGLDVGLNLKRGGPSISNDFIAWRNGDITEGVDIASGYDDTSIPLKLQWHRYSKAESYGFPFYKSYGPVSCIVDPPVEPEHPVPPANDLEKRITALEQEVARTLVRLSAAENGVTVATQEARYATDVAADALAAQQAYAQKFGELFNEIAILKNRLANVTCKALFGCRVVVPE